MIVATDPEGGERTAVRSGSACRGGLLRFWREIGDRALTVPRFDSGYGTAALDRLRRSARHHTRASMFPARRPAIVQARAGHLASRGKRTWELSRRRRPWSSSLTNPPRSPITSSPWLMPIPSSSSAGHPPSPSSPPPGGPRTLGISSKRRRRESWWSSMGLQRPGGSAP